MRGVSARKRRKLSPKPESAEIEPFNDSDAIEQASSHQLRLNSKAKTEGNSPKEKPKSKHRIHIPKNAGIPKDSFYTQPPHRSSPYRIDEFCWQKPQRQSMSPSSKPHSPTPITPRSAYNPKELNQALRLNDVQTDVLCSSPDSVHRAWDVREGNYITAPLDDNSCHLSRCASESIGNAVIQGYEDVLAELPSDAFSSPSTSPKGLIEPILLLSQDQETQTWYFNDQCQVLAAPRSNLRQTTLFGSKAPENSSHSQSVRKYNWPLANREEPTTHHKLDRDALNTWVYPTNLGTIRDYQYSIVARGLYHNMLVALPTGLGKTFIAATIMLNWFRWTTEAQIVFVAPTKPLVSQQVKACFEIAGIPRSTTTMLTGATPPGIRAEEWLRKRVFFMTPQTIINDLKSGICDPKRIVLLVVDEAHRATGGYAYVEVVKFLNRFNSSFRVLALTATPGATIEGVQEVIDGLGISRIEIRTEESLDIRQYVHSRKVETILFDSSEEMVMLMDLFAKALQPVLEKLNGMNAYWLKDPMSLTPYGCNQARMKWMSSDAGKNANLGVKGMVNTIFSLLASLAHGIELLKYHGIGPFYHKVLGFREGEGERLEKGGKYRKQIIESMHFQTMMARIQSWINKPDFIGHPKLDYLQSIVLKHFVDAGDGQEASDPTSTRIMVFAHYRDSAEEIARVLKRNDPIIRPHVFVGQANSKGSDGMDQKMQLTVIKKFQEGIYNTLVATSIGEEGLDIGEVDLIVCYDASASPIRMLQRMGRTGRKRAGNIVVTLMKGKEETNFIKAKDNYEKMQVEIAAGTRFNYHEEQSRRIVPKDVQPVADKRIIEIPPENSQEELPEPRKRARPPKRPAKRFHMPDGVQTGFRKASRMEAKAPTDDKFLHNRSRLHKKTPTLEPVPSLDEVLLTAAEGEEFAQTYLNVHDDAPRIVDVPKLDAFPMLQASLRPTKHVGHGWQTIQFVETIKSMRNASKKIEMWYEDRLGRDDRQEGLAQVAKRNGYFQGAHKALSTQARNANFSSGPDEGSSGNQDDHNLIQVMDDKTDEIYHAPSSISPPLAFTKTSEPYYQPANKTYDVESDSNEDLPELSTLVKVNEFRIVSRLDEENAGS